MSGRYCVTMTDRFMSGWGPARGKINKFVVECPTLDIAEKIAQAASDRPEMRHVGVREKKPYYRPAQYLTSWRDWSELGGPWLSRFSADDLVAHEAACAKRNELESAEG